MQAAEEKAAEQLADSSGIDRGEFKKLAFLSPESIGNDGVAMRMEVGSIRTEGLDRQHADRRQLIGCPLPFSSSKDQKK